LPAFILFLIFAGVQVWVSRKLMAPLNQVTALVTQKSPRDLSPIQIEKLPGELSPLVGSINAMLPRLSRALEAEQRFTSDAAHELRTPLSALAMKAQLLKRQYPEVEPALLALTTDINRATSLIEQLLQLARLDPLNDDIHPITEEEIALADYVEGWLAPHREVARQKGISLTHTIPPDLLARVNPGLLGIALRNLIENALIYTEQGGKIEVSAGVKETGLTLTVADNGVGVPPEHYAQLANRFYRVLGTGKTGSGLGLSIVKRIAELHRGTLTFGEGLDGKGLSVTVTCAYLPQK
ncbi:MAG: two-component sensor histidine kinase, partial [Burkholderiales bacterium]|nr:two-component sensor histidine kinase [Burkholderiales bacterium]